MLSDIILRSTAAFGGAPFRLNKCTALTSAAISQYFSINSSVSGRSATGFAKFCSSSQTYSDVFVCDGYRYCRAAKLLMALGYGNFDTVIQYDICYG